MSKKQRRRAGRPGPKPAQLAPEAVERKAREDLAAGRHREAIIGFKQLLKLEQRPAWRSALAEAYAGRARELTAKGLLKEALAIWENRAGLGEAVVFHPDHATLLLRMGQVGPVLGLLQDAAAIPPAERNRLRPLLAARYLVGAERMAEQLPADEPVVLHGQAARAALVAYCAGDDTALEEALSAIPFRSPYRDWVQILKALQRLPERPGEAADLLARVDQDSAFGQLKRAAELALLPETDFLVAISGVGSTPVRFACTLRGWPPERIALWEELDRLGPKPRPETLLRVMYRHIEALGADWVRRRGLRLLIQGFPASLRWLKSMGARPASEDEVDLVAAWDAEEQGEPWHQLERWEGYARRLMHARKGAGNDPDHKLRIALALRRCAQLGDVLAHAVPSDDPHALDSQVAKQLEQSLAWDPDDRDTHLRLIQYYRRGKRLKDARRHLDQAAVRWPEDLQVLGAALDTALDAGSFKKAAALAREILARDPINSGVRERLLEAHLAHARKQITKGRADLARKELAEAGEWARGGHARDQLDLTAGLIALMEDAKTGAPALRDLIERLGGGLGARLAVALAGEAISLSPQTLMATIGLKSLAKPSRDDLLASLARLRTHLDGGGRISHELDTYLAKALTNAPWASLSRGEVEGACDTLRRCGLHRVRLHVARGALKHWPEEPVFELHAFEAKYPNGYDGWSDKDLIRLQTALGRAREAGDTRTVLRIEEALAELGPFGLGPMPFPPPPGAGILPAEVSDVHVIAKLIEVVGLDQTLNMLGAPPSVKRELKDVERQLGSEGVAQTLLSIFEMIRGISEGEMGPPIPRPPPRKANAPKGGRPRRRSTDDPDDDDPFADQLDLL